MFREQNLKYRRLSILMGPWFPADFPVFRNSQASDDESCVMWYFMIFPLYPAVIIKRGNWKILDDFPSASISNWFGDWKKNPTFDNFHGGEWTQVSHFTASFHLFCGSSFTFRSNPGPTVSRCRGRGHLPGWAGDRWPMSIIDSCCDGHFPNL